MNYKELKAKDWEQDLSQQQAQKTLAQRLENWPQKSVALLKDLPVRGYRVLKRGHYLLNLGILSLRNQFELTKQFDYPKANIYMRVTSAWEYKRLRPYHKEPWTVEWLENVLKAGDVFYDIGANVGGYSLIAAKMTGGQVKVFAFEPSFATFTTLCKNIVLNNCQTSITPFQIALSSQTGLASFNYSSLMSGAASHSLGEAEEGVSPVYQQAVISYSLDDFIDQFKLPVPNHIKLDVDGPELAVLHGAKQTLSNPQVRSLMLELNEDEQHSDEVVVTLLESHGFYLQKRHLRYDSRGKRRSYSFCLFGRNEL